MSGLLRQQLQRRTVPGADDREVPAVERRHLRLVETLAEGDDGRVDQPEVQPRVRALELGGPREVARLQRRRCTRPRPASWASRTSTAAGEGGSFRLLRSSPEAPSAERSDLRPILRTPTHASSTSGISGSDVRAAARPRPPPPRVRRRLRCERRRWRSRSCAASRATVFRRTCARETPRLRASSSSTARSVASAARVVRRVGVHLMPASLPARDGRRRASCLTAIGRPPARTRAEDAFGGVDFL